MNNNSVPNTGQNTGPNACSNVCPNAGPNAGPGSCGSRLSNGIEVCDKRSLREHEDQCEVRVLDIHTYYLDIQRTC
jgi:hypothetical protein